LLLNTKPELQAWQVKSICAAQFDIKGIETHFPSEVIENPVLHFEQTIPFIWAQLSIM
jgi:hypothetical protein